MNTSLKRVAPRLAVFVSGLAFAQVASAIGPTGVPFAPLDAPSMIVQPEVSIPTRLNVTFRSGGQMVSERGEITLAEHDDGTFTVIGDGVFIEETDGVEVERGRFHYEIGASVPPNITLVQGATGDWVAVGNSPLQVLIFSESLSANEEEWTLQVRNLLSGSVSIATGGVDSNRDELGETKFFTALATVVLMQEATGECDPSYGTCRNDAETACEPDRYQVTYTCNPETGEVHCSWTCHPLGGGGSGDD